MPRSSEVTLTCACGTRFPSTAYQAVNVTLEPALLYRLLFGHLNVATCPNCGRTSSTGQPFVYHDMQRGLFAYVLPQADVSDEEREALLTQLRRVYTQAVEESERISQSQQRERTGEVPRPVVRRRTPQDELRAQIEPDAPPMQVIFGVDRLVTLVDSLLEPEERLGKVALSTRSAQRADRERLSAVAQRMAAQMQCEIAVEDEPDEYTVWLYGPKSRTNAIAKALNTPA
jgi:CpXC protein